MLAIALENPAIALENLPRPPGEMRVGAMLAIALENPPALPKQPGLALSYTTQHGPERAAQAPQPHVRILSRPY
jgi:hypothetical protein